MTRSVALSVLAAALAAAGCGDAPESPAITPAPAAEVSAEPAKPAQLLAQDLRDVVAASKAANSPDGAFSRQRLKDLKALNTAILAYAAKNGGKYPATKGWHGFASDYGASLGDNWIPELVPTYIAATPRDPLKSEAGNGPQYLYQSDGADYKLLAHLTGDCPPQPEMTPAGPSTDGPIVDPSRDEGPGGLCWGYGYWTVGATGF